MELDIDIKKCSSFRKFTGLMFRTKNTSALIFEFKEPTLVSIHSMFVFFSFYAIWVDDRDEIIEIKEVKPFTASIIPKRKFVKLLEIPISLKYNAVLELLESNNTKTKGL